MPQRAERFSELAEEALNEALDIEPNALSYILLNEVKKRQKDFDGAEALLYRQPEANPPQKELAIVESGLGDIANLREDFEQGLKHFQRVSNLDPDSRTPGCTSARPNACSSNIQKQQTPCNRPSSKIRRISPFSAELTQVYANSGNFSQAIELG